MSEMPLLDKWRNRTGLVLRPLQASLELTYRCNERCTHCYIDKFEDDAHRVLRLEQWVHILGELREAGVLYLILMGGEAMLNPHFWGILSKAKDLGFHVSMITNGLKIPDTLTAQKLFESGLSVATVSLYSLNSEVHDRMTSVRGSHARTMAAIEHLSAAGITVGINCLLTKANVEGYFDFADWCIKRGFEIKADPMITPKFSGDLSPTKFRMSEEQIRWYYETLSEKWPRGTPKPSNEEPDDHVCNVAKGKCAVTAYGELLTCIEVREPLGKLTEKNFKELWMNATAEKWRNMRIQDLENRPQGSSGSMCDHCPGMANHEHANPKRLTEYALLQGRIKSEVYERNRHRIPD